MQGQIKCLSFARRLQLIQSVSYGIQVYWSNMFIFTMKVIKSIEQKFNRFLWRDNDEGNASAKVDWDQVCLPKKAA